MTALAMVFANYTNLALLVAHIAFILTAVFSLRRRKPHHHAPKSPARSWFVQWLGSEGVVLSLLAVWFLSHTEEILGYARPPRPFELSGLKALALHATYPFYAFGLGETLFPWRLAGALGVAAVAGLLVAGVVRLSRAGLGGLLAMIGLFVTLMLTVAALYLFVRDLPFATVPPRAIGALPFFVIMLAAGLEGLPPRGRFVAVLTLSVAFAAGWVNYFAGRDFHNPIYAVPTREMAATVAEESRAGDVILTEVDIGFDYYYRKPSVGPRLILLDPPDSIPAALTAQPAPERVWLVTIGRDASRALAPVAVERLLARSYRLVSSRGYVPEDPTYGRVKELIQGFADYRYKALIRLYD